MIHSTAGGKLKEYSYYDIAKVKYLENEQVAFVLCPIKEVKEKTLWKWKTSLRQELYELIEMFMSKIFP
mgnify:FL=1